MSFREHMSQKEKSVTASSGPSGRELDDYSGLCDGDVDPALRKKIRTLIVRDKSYIVYLDEDLYVEWGVLDEYIDARTNKDWERISNKATHLETLSMQLVPKRDLLRFRRLIAEGVARFLQDKNAVAANEILHLAKHAWKPEGWSEPAYGFLDLCLYPPYLRLDLSSSFGCTAFRCVRALVTPP